MHPKPYSIYVRVSISFILLFLCTLGGLQLQGLGQSGIEGLGFGAWGK